MESRAKSVAEAHIVAFFVKGRAAFARENFGLPERTWLALVDKAAQKAISHLRGESWQMARDGIVRRLVEERTTWLAQHDQAQGRRKDQPAE